MNSRIKKRLFTSVFLLLSFLLTLALLEISLRILVRQNDKIKILSYNARYCGNYENKLTLKRLLGDTIFGFRPCEITAGFKSNSKSFRTKEYSESKQDGVYRIITIGDSFTYDSGKTPYAKHWPALLENTLQDTLSKSIEIINLGVPGVGPHFELRLWQLEGAKLDPDLVILAFCIGNDFTDESKMSLPESSLGDQIADYSYIYRVVRNWRRYKDSERQNKEFYKQMKNLTGHNPNSKDHSGAGSEKCGCEVGGYEYDGNTPTHSERNFAGLVSARMRICKKTSQFTFEKLFSKVSSVLLEFYNEVTSSGAEFLLVMIPEEYQVDNQVFSDAAEHDHSFTSNYDIHMPQLRLIQFCETHGINYIDMLPEFERRSKSETLYKLRDTHWNIDGNALAVELLTGKLLKDYERLTERPAH
jgi:hypothetical protein